MSPFFDFSVYFNPRTHMECDKLFSVYCFRSFISIHALTWSATKFFMREDANGLFQSTHSHGVRRFRVPDAADIVVDFNPRTHMECDRNGLLITDRTTDFNPRTHMECDREIRTVNSRYLTFQSTHSHGVRLPLLESSKQTAEFQSTHSHGVRQRPQEYLRGICKFQSTHSHGVRLVYIYMRC